MRRWVAWRSGRGSVPRLRVGLAWLARGGRGMAGVGAAGAGEGYWVGIVGDFGDADIGQFEGDVEAEVVAAGEEPVAEGIVDPVADASDDL
jgi:hypothetical protein